MHHLQHWRRLLHLRLRDHLAPDVARAVLAGYRHRFTALRGAVTETEPTFDTARLAEIPVAGHSPQFENPEAWRSSLEDFLGSL